MSHPLCLLLLLHVCFLLPHSLSFALERKLANHSLASARSARGPSRGRVTGPITILSVLKLMQSVDFPQCQAGSVDFSLIMVKRCV